MSLPKLHQRTGWLIAFTMALATTNLLACDSARTPTVSDRVARLNLPSGVEPAKHAPKQYRSEKHYDPDYNKHPSRWRRRLRARYA